MTGSTPTLVRPAKSAKSAEGQVVMSSLAGQVVIMDECHNLVRPHQAYEVRRTLGCLCFCKRLGCSPESFF